MSASDTASYLKLKLRNQFTPLQLLPPLFHLAVNLWCKLDLKEGATTNKIKCRPKLKQGGKGAAELLSNKSHAAANVSLLAHEQNLPTAALT